MFRKLSNRMSSLFGNEKVNTLVNMGFDANQAANALEATGGNVERAAELLLVASNNETRSTNRIPQQEVVDLTGTYSNQTHEQMMEKAMRESLASEEERLKKQKATSNSKKATKKKSNSPIRSKRTPAALAAEARANQMTSKSSINSNPKYKMPTPLKNKSKEELIPRLAARLSPYPRAVDTLNRALTALKNDPSNAKYRTIDKNTKGYQATLQNVPSAEDLLLALNFQRRTRGEHGILVIERAQVDIALLWIAISSIEKASKTKEYKIAKKKVEFEKAVRKLLSVQETQVSETEIAARLEYSKKLCTEPREQQGAIHQNIALMQIHLLPERVVKRRFDGDDQLRDIINWMGTFDSTLATKLKNGEWCLVDKNISNPTPIPCDERSLNFTLQRIGCWPSGKLELREGGSKDQIDLKDLQEVTRGLGVSASAESKITS